MCPGTVLKVCLVGGGWVCKPNLVLVFGPNQASCLWLRLGPSQTIHFIHLFCCRADSVQVCKLPDKQDGSQAEHHSYSYLPDLAGVDIILHLNITSGNQNILQQQKVKLSPEI